MCIKKGELEIIWTSHLWSKCQLVIPKKARDVMWLKPWDAVVLLIQSWKYIWIVKKSDLKSLLEYIESANNM